MTLEWPDKLESPWITCRGMKLSWNMFLKVLKPKSGRYKTPEVTWGKLSFLNLENITIRMGPVWALLELQLDWTSTDSPFEQGYPSRLKFFTWDQNTFAQGGESLSKWLIASWINTTILLIQWTTLTWFWLSFSFYVSSIQ